MKPQHPNAMPQPPVPAPQAEASPTTPAAPAPLAGRKLCPKLILEGTRLTSKTELALALHEHPRIVGPRKYRYHAPLISAEWCAFTNFPWGRGLINFDPAEEPLALETYRTWLRLFELQRYYSWIIDRWHLSTQVYQQQTHGRSYDFGWLEEGLVDLGFHLVLCVRDPSSFAAARAERLKVSGNPRQYDDLAPFIHEQTQFQQAAAASRLPRLTVDMTTGDIPGACAQIADWLTKTGGLWARE